jgi:hypothetical protein
MKLWGPAALAAMLTICACGGTASDVAAHGDQPTSTSLVPSTTSTTKPPATTTATDRQIEAAGALRLSDLPASWSVLDGGDETPEDEVLDRELALCMGLPESFLNPGHERPVFIGPDSEVVSGGVALVGSRMRNSQIFDAVERPTSLRCLEDVTRKGMDGEPGDTVAAQRLDNGPLGDRSIVFRLVENLGGGTMTVDLAFVQRGRAVILLTVVGSDAPVPQSFTVDLVGKIGSRLPASVTA